MTANDIIESVAEVFGVTVAELQSHSRRELFARARELYAYLCRRHTRLSHPDIAEALGWPRSSHSMSVEGTGRWRARLLDHDSGPVLVATGPRQPADVLTARATILANLESARNSRLPANPPQIVQDLQEPKTRTSGGSDLECVRRQRRGPWRQGAV